MSEFLDNWLPFIYLYGVGGILFFTGLILIKRSKSINLQLKRHRFWYRTLIFGFLYFMFMHFILTIAGLYW